MKCVGITVIGDLHEAGFTRLSDVAACSLLPYMFANNKYRYRHFLCVAIWSILGSFFGAVIKSEVNGFVLLLGKAAAWF